MPYYDQYGPNFDMGGGNATRDYAQSGGSGDLMAALSRLFGRSSMPASGPGSVQTAALPPPPGSTQTGGPFGGPGGPYDPGNAQSPSPVPSTQLASAKAITDRINKMLGVPEETTPVDWSSFGIPLPPFQQDNTMAGQRYPGGSGPAAGIRYPSASPFDIFGMAPPRRQHVDMRRADGGQIPGFMRGGYPELYNSPVRHTFDSGGESYVADGEGGGRADNVNARLSPREYVMDAETMALLGDGNPDEGAKKMDELRQNIRKHKGKKLAKGDISPNAKPASSYIGRNALGVGLSTMSTKS